MFKSPKNQLFSLAVATALAAFPCAGLAQATDPNGTAPTGAEQNQMDRYLNNHPEAAKELHENPSLVNDPKWLGQHPEVQRYMNQHPNVKQSAAANPKSIVNSTERNTLQQDHKMLTNSNQYLAQHPEVRSELKNNPKLIDDPKYLAAHPDLDKELKEHPEIRQEAMNHPNDFKKASEANGQYNKNHPQHHPTTTPTPKKK
jgi:hypothetical protein